MIFLYNKCDFFVPCGKSQFVEDINECLVSSPCHENATCTNAFGTYKCQCKSGFSGDGMICKGKKKKQN